MSSRFGWLDQDDDQRRNMLAVVELFKDEGSVDELGIGSIRDAIADALFPGTSVLQTRARYLLLIPWLLQQVTRSSTNADRASEELRAREIQVIYALLNGGETDGVIGQQAKKKLQRMPSAAYWASLGRYGIRTVDATIDGFLGLQITADMSAATSPSPDDPGAATGERASLLHPDLPPPPTGLLSKVDFALSPAEASFLRERLQTTTQGSLFAWLVAHGGSSDVEGIWDHPQRSRFPEQAEAYVDRGQRFACAIHGAALLYNRLLAERRESDKLIEQYDLAIAGWQRELDEVRPFDGMWTPAVLWTLLERDGRPVRPSTRAFAESWLRTVEAKGADACSDNTMRTAVRQREIQLKGGRARLVNDAALDAWSGASGLVRLDYRWRVARRLLADLDVVEPALVA